MIVSVLLAALILLVGGWPATASVCVDCHTDENMLKQNLTGAQRRVRSALTSGAG